MSFQTTYGGVKWSKRAHARQALKENNQGDLAAWGLTRREDAQSIFKLVVIET